MSTLPPPGVKEFPADSIEKKVYGLVEELKDFIPLDSDRNRLGFCLYKYIMGEGDAPKVLLKTAKINFRGISHTDLSAKIDDGLKGLQ